MAPMAGRSIRHRESRGAAAAVAHGRQLTAAAANPCSTFRRLAEQPAGAFAGVFMTEASMGNLPEPPDLCLLRILSNFPLLRQRPVRR